MGVLQAAVVGPLGCVVGERFQAAVGFVLMGVGLGGLVVARSFTLVLTAIAFLAIGTALVVPNLTAMVATHSGGHFGAALGLKSAATSLGQFLGPLVGGAMLAWVPASPYVLAATLMLVLGVLLARSGVRTSAPLRRTETGSAGSTRIDDQRQRHTSDARLTTP